MKSNKEYDKSKIVIGHKFHGYDGYLNHIIAQFEDEGEIFFVLKFWAKYRKRWGYEVESKDMIEWTFDQLRNNLKRKK